MQPAIDTNAAAERLGEKIGRLIDERDRFNEMVFAELGEYSIWCNADYVRYSDGYFDDVDLDLDITNIHIEDADCREYPIQLDPVDILAYIPGHNS